MKGRKNILVIRLSALGDVAMTIPAIYSLAKAYPMWNIKVLTDERFVPLFIDRPSNVSFILYTKSRYGSVGGLLRLLCFLRNENFSMVADFHNVLRSWIIDIFLLLCGCKVRLLQKHRVKRCAILYRHFTFDPPVTQRYFDVLIALGFDVPILFDKFHVDVQVDSLPCSKSNERWIGIAPFARYESKVYPLSLMEEVVASLNNQTNTCIFLFGGGSQEVAKLSRLAEKYERVHTLAGQLSLKQELFLMSQLDVMLTMDSSNMHLASLVGIRVVSLWGSTSPACGFLGWQQSLDDAICLNLPCQPCSIAGRKDCPARHFRCMKTISSQMVLKRLINQECNL